MKKIWCYVDTETECDELCTIIDDWFKFRELKKRAGLDGYGYYYCNDEDMTKDKQMQTLGLNHKYLPFALRCTSIFISN